MINELAKQAFENAKNKGFWDDKRSVAETLCLIHSEVSEALEADRKGIYCTYSIKAVNECSNDDEFKALFKENVKDSFEDELADAMIRIFDLAHSKNIDLEQHIKAKMRYNSLREHKHGKKY